MYVISNHYSIPGYAKLTPIICGSVDVSSIVSVVLFPVVCSVNLEPPAYPLKENGPILRLEDACHDEAEL